MGEKRGARKLTRKRYSNAAYSWDDLGGPYFFALEAEGRAAGTIRNRREYFGTLVDWAQANGTAPADFSTDSAREFVHYLRHDHVKHARNHCVADKFKTAGMSVATVNSYIKSLRIHFRFLAEEGYVTENPFERVKLLPAERDTVNALTMQQVARLLKEPDQRSYAGFRDYVMMLLLIDTGIRLGEALTLRRSDVDFRANTLTVRGEVAKNGRTRHVPFSSKTGRLLRELLVEVDDFATSLIFVSSYGNALDPSWVRERVRQYADKAGLHDYKVSPHVLRHTFAKYYLLNGGDPMTLQKILGHSSLDMVRVYIQMTPEDNRVQHAKFTPLNNL